MHLGGTVSGFVCKVAGGTFLDIRASDRYELGHIGCIYELFGFPHGNLTLGSFFRGGREGSELNCVT